MTVIAEPHQIVTAPGGLTVADLRAGYDPGFRFELEDGVAVMMAAATLWHNRVLRRLAVAMETHCPAHLSVEVEQAIEITDDFAPVPDIVVVDRAAALPEENVLPKSAITLAVEIVSPSTRRKDRMIRPMDYARAGIPYFWRIEPEDFEPVAYTFRLDDSTGQYLPTDVHRKLLETSEPFEMRIELIGLGG
ncbi:Uma2 family endonuclease [Nocardia sp. NPDC050406]|uniref:Uma2 family endonuclease n=1 Tax=Nocardia sp. NPDC050406 TaxID=3364318 RepID=UPI00378C4B91